jgi:3D (Asp-Asp-Asp) domain-containing protein
LKKAAVKYFCGVFVNSRVVLAVILIIAIVCVPTCIVGMVYAKAGWQVTLPSGTVADSKPTSEQSGEWQTVRMRVTAYCPCPKCCGEYSGGPTACGHKILLGDTFVAADGKYDFGTEMLIAGYNNGEPVKVLDRGGAIRGDRLDVFFGSHEEALKWGVKYIDVKVHRKLQTQ